MESTAELTNIRITPRKMRLVADNIRNNRVDVAMGKLALSTKKSAGVILKVVKSAIANAEQTKEMDIDNLIIKEIMVDEGPKLKRFVPRAMGRATPMWRRFSRVKVRLAEKF